MSQTIESFLIALKFDTPEGELGKVQKFLGDAEHLVSRHASGVAKDLLVWQIGVTSAFTAVAGATVGLVEHVASADQRFRLFGERFMMSTQQAREL